MVRLLSGRAGSLTKRKVSWYRKDFGLQFRCDCFPLPHKPAAPAVPEFSISGGMDLHCTLPRKGDNLAEQIAFATPVELLSNRASKTCHTLLV